MNLSSIHALVLRYLFLFLRNWPRLVEVFFWPIINLIMWGFLTRFLSSETEGFFSEFIIFLIGAMIFWDILFRSQQAVAFNFLEDVWSRNLINIFVAPIRIREYLAATFIVGIIRSFATGTVLAILAYTLYSFNLFDLKMALIPFYLNLLLFGWILGVFATTLIMRWGHSAQNLAWVIPFMIQPFSAVFYPLETLPKWLHPLSLCLPTTHVFEGMRSVLRIGEIPWQSLILATAINSLFALGASWFFVYMFQVAREKGLITKLASQ